MVGLLGSLFWGSAAVGGTSVIYNKSKKGEIKPKELAGDAVELTKQAFSNPKEAFNDLGESIDEFLTNTGEIVEHPVDSAKDAAAESLGIGNGKDLENAIDDPMSWLAKTFTKTLGNGETEIDTTKALWFGIPTALGALLLFNQVSPDNKENNLNWSMILTVMGALIGANSYKDEISNALGFDEKESTLDSLTI